MVFMILAFGGFEGSTVLGLEAKNPRRALRLAVIGSVLVVAVFFLLNAYVQVLGFESLKANLGTQAAPLSTLASHDNVSWARRPDPARRHGELLSPRRTPR